jgi:ferredoxin--NADP+ reductase/benzoate/toluate 1,2-dioxygenase reductase subunit
LNNESTKHRVVSIRELSPSAYVLRFERQDVSFEPGQYIHVGPLPGIDRREYSVYSSPEDDFLEILVKEIPVGEVSPKLRRLRAGEYVDVEGPFGFFQIESGDRDRPHVFVATGTGISPFHSITRRYPELNYRLIHGIRNGDESYDHGAYPEDRLVRCHSRSDDGDYTGRVTDWLKGHPVDTDSMVYLCGNCDMIYEAADILSDQGLPADRVYAEVYF